MKELNVKNRRENNRHKRDNFERLDEFVEFSADCHSIQPHFKESGKKLNIKTNFNINADNSRDFLYQNSLSTNSNILTSKMSREVYVGNLPIGVNVAQLLEFINLEMLNHYKPHICVNPVISAWINSDGKYAFCECRSIDEANNLLRLNNSLNLNGHILRMGKPKVSESSNTSEIKYLSSIYTNSLSQNLGIISPYFCNIPLVISKKELFLLTKISYSLNINDIREYIEERGNVRVLDLIEYKRKYKVAICEAETTDRHSLEWMFDIFGDKIRLLSLKDISENNKMIKLINRTLLSQIKDVRDKIKQSSYFGAIKSGIDPSIIIPNSPCSCIVLQKLLTFEEVTTSIIDSITVEIENECSRFGEVVKLVIPRPEEMSEILNKSDMSVGSIFILYKTVESAMNAKLNLNKMRFLGRRIKVKYLPESEFLDNIIHRE